MQAKRVSVETLMKSRWEGAVVETLCCDKAFRLKRNNREKIWRNLNLSIVPPIKNVNYKKSMNYRNLNKNHKGNMFSVNY